MFLASVVGISQCALPSPISMVSTTITPTLDHTTQLILIFLDRLHNILIPAERMNDADHQRNWYVVAWDNMSFHRAAQSPKTGLLTTHHCAVPPNILTMVVEGIWPAALRALACCAGYGRRMWWNWCGCDSGMDKTLKVLLPLKSGKRSYCLWCGRGVVDRPSCPARCCLVIFLASLFSIFFLHFFFSVNCFVSMLFTPV